MKLEQQNWSSKIEVAEKTAEKRTRRREGNMRRKVRSAKGRVPVYSGKG